MGPGKPAQTARVAGTEKTGVQPYGAPRPSSPSPWGRRSHPERATHANLAMREYPDARDLQTIDVHGPHDVGSGDAVLLGNSFLWDAQMWRPQIDALATHYRVIAPDLWGHGGSGPLPPGTTMRGLAEHHLALMDHLEIGRFAVVGLSVGAMWAAELALMAPDRVAGVALVNSALRRRPGGGRGGAAVLLANPGAALAAPGGGVTRPTVRPERRPPRGQRRSARRANLRPGGSRRSRWRAADAGPGGCERRGQVPLRRRGAGDGRGDGGRVRLASEAGHIAALEVSLSAPLTAWLERALPTQEETPFPLWFY